ncbi:MAG: hypothetical protein ACO248_00840 [Burkholderiaceae bacterium]
MIAANLAGIQRRAELAGQRMQLLAAALDAADALLAALHEATIQPTPTAMNALAAAEKRYAEARQAVDGRRAGPRG